LFERSGFHPRTDLGQNFLIDLNIVDFIVNEAQLGPDDVVLEVGAGTGGMTAFLAQQAAAVISVEVDEKIFRLAESFVAGYPNVTLLRTDVLKNKNSFSPIVLETVEQKLAEDPNRRLKLVSNLPYSVATPVVSNLVATELPWELMVVTIQKELGYRMAAKPGRSNYGALSVWLQAQCRVKILKILPPSVFWPRPQVRSAVVRLLPHEQRRKRIEDRPFFHDFVRRLFQQRRKLLRSGLIGMYRKQLRKEDVDALLQALEISPQARAEDMGVETLVELSNRVHQRLRDDVGIDVIGREGE
ncbi:MAG: 16S rRNA (adenine(1518)-N(6)/adenine(1519)-N(6))-dimethyltransferase RsmA, partial [Planctomycetaceae bacterium]